MFGGLRARSNQRAVEGVVGVLEAILEELRAPPKQRLYATDDMVDRCGFCGEWKPQSGCTLCHRIEADL